MRVGLLFLVFLLCAGIVPTASAHNPTGANFLQPDFLQDWKTLETAHFRIHHVASHKEFAQQMGAIAERVHERLTPWLGWEPAAQTEVVILDSVDYSNGYATPLPYNRFYIYMPTPVEGEIMDNNPWLELVFTHEYTHILHLDQAFAAPKVMRSIFGRSTSFLLLPFVFPEEFAPSWVAEGIAVYSESDNDAGYGRLNNAWYEAMMRMEVQRGLRSLNETSFEGYSGSRWPYGLNYLYGAYFFRFVDERYGRDKVVNYIRIYGRNMIPWRMDKRAKQIFGKPAKTVWREYQEYLKQRFEPELAAIAKKSAVATRTVYAAPYTSRLLTATGKGELYFYHNDDSSHPKIFSLRADGSAEPLFKAEEVMHLDWQDDAGLLISKLAVCGNVNAYADLYVWKPGMSGPEELTHCGRYPIAAWRADGQAIAAVQFDGGLSRLVLLDEHGQQAQTLAELPPGDALGHVAWSPDGKRIAAAVKRLRSGWHIELFDLDTRQWQALTSSGDREIRPRFSADGNEIYFLSDHDKVWNLRRLRLGGNTVETLSNTRSGIEEAVAMPDGSYRLVEYTPQGLAITALEQPASIGKSYAAHDTKAPPIKAITTAADYRPIPYDNVTDYSALSTMAPRAWLPIAGANADTTSFVGVMVNGSDVLGFHSWTLAPYYYTSLKAWGGYAAYNFYDTLNIAVMRQFLVRGNVNAPVRYRDDEGRYQALLGHSFNSFEADLYLAAGVGGEKVNTEVLKGAGTPSSSRDTLTGAIARYDDSEFFRRSISLVDGRRIQLSGESYDLLGKNTYRGKTYRLDWKEYFELGDNHVLLLRWQRAFGDPTIRPYVLGGEIPPINTLGGDIELGRRNFELRGYAPSLLGTRFSIGTAEWRIPLGVYYNGFFVPPLGVGKQSLSLFVDRGSAWNAGEKAQLKTGAGLEWNVESQIGYDLLHLWITTGYAHGFDKPAGGGNRWYLRLGAPF